MGCISKLKIFSFLVCAGVLFVNLVLFLCGKRPMEQAIPSWKSNQSRLLYVKINEFLPQKVGGCFKGRFLTLMLMGTEK